jgi:FeS assembly SUF system regulator
MVRMGRLTDYGVVVMSHFAAHPERLHNATEVASATRLHQPTVSKLLRLLARSGLLESHRGVKGGYSLARPPEQISAAAIIRALEGPVSLTVCSGEDGPCEHEPACPVRGHWQGINLAVLRALESVSLSELASRKPGAELPSRIFGGLRQAVGHHEVR